MLLALLVGYSRELRRELTEHPLSMGVTRHLGVDLKTLRDFAVCRHHVRENFLILKFEFILFQYFLIELFSTLKQELAFGGGISEASE
jgi:hypothetical protein